MNTLSLYFSDCPYFIITPSLQYPEYGGTVHFSGVIPDQLKLPIDPRWQKVIDGYVGHNLDLSDEKYRGSHVLSPPLLVINAVDYDDQGDYRLQVKTSTGWCSSITAQVHLPIVYYDEYMEGCSFLPISFFIITEYSV